MNELEKSTLIKQVAVLAVSGGNSKEIGAKLSIDVSKVRKIMQDPEYQAVVKKLGDDALATARQTVRVGMAKMAREVIRVIEHKLRKNDINAVKAALQVMGLTHPQEEEQKGDTTINVVLPGQKQEVEVKAEYGDKDAV